MTLIKYNNRPSLIEEMNHWIENLSIQTPINFYNKSISWVPQFEVREIDDRAKIKDKSTNSIQFYRSYIIDCLIS